jgi:hypothetical protein
VQSIPRAVERWVSDTTENGRLYDAETTAEVWPRGGNCQVSSGGDDAVADHQAPWLPPPRNHNDSRSVFPGRMRWTPDGEPRPPRRTGSGPPRC